MSIYTERAAGTGNSVTFTNNRSEDMRLHWGHLTYVSSGTAGNREIRMRVANAAGTLMYDTHAGVVQAASATVHYNFPIGTFRETTVVQGELHVPISDMLYIAPGWTITFLDNVNIAAASDTYDVVIQWSSI